MSSTERSLRSFVRWGLRGTVVFPVVAFLLGWLVYLLPGRQLPDRPSVADFWAWLADREGAGIDVLALVSGAALSLFVATQIRSSVARDSDEAAAQAVGLDAITSLVCACAAVVAWLAFPGLTAGSGHPVNVGVAIFVPLLCTWLSAFVRPSAESAVLARARASRRLRDLDRLLAEFRQTLPRGSDGRVLGSRAADGRRIRLRTAGFAAVIGVVAAGATLTVLHTFGGPHVPVHTEVVRVTGAFVLAGTVYLFTAYQLSELYVSRLADGAWLVLLFAVSLLGQVLLLLAAALGIWLDSGLRGIALFLVLTGLPIGAALVGRRSLVMGARAYREVRRRTAAVLRLEREREAGQLPKVVSSATKGLGHG